MSGRWLNYFLEQDFRQFWKSRLDDGSGDKISMIVGIGFDPRSLTALRAISSVVPEGDKVNCLALCLRPPSIQLTSSYQILESLTETNLTMLRNLSNVNLLGVRDVSLRDDSGHLVGDRLATRIVSEHLGEIAKTRDVLVDISGLPRTVFFPLIKYLCREADRGTISNLHVAVTEDPGLDGQIRSGEFGSPDFIYSFPGKFSSNRHLVWLPALSSGESSRLEKIHVQIERDCAEICPILPFPAINLRRADDIVMRLKTILFERMLVSENNLLLCDEQTPFDIYRKILDVDEYYQKTLSSLSGLEEIQTVVSPLTSKMLSLGMLLAAIELDLAVSYTEAGSYQIDDDFGAAFDETISPVEIWLTGEAYD